VYKNASGVLQILWKLIKVAWEKEVYLGHSAEQVEWLYLKKDPTSSQSVASYFTIKR